MSDTPLTDAFTFDVEGDDVMKTELVSADFARSLEIRVAELTKERDEARGILDQLDHDFERQSPMQRPPMAATVDYIAQAVSDRDELRKQVSELTAKLEEARKDSERVDKVESMPATSAVGKAPSGNWQVFGPAAKQFVDPTAHKTFREAIDALPPAPSTE